MLYFYAAKVLENTLDQFLSGARIPNEVALKIRQRVAQPRWQSRPRKFLFHASREEAARYKQRHAENPKEQEIIPMQRCNFHAEM